MFSFKNAFKPSLKWHIFMGLKCYRIKIRLKCTFDPPILDETEF